MPQHVIIGGELEPRGMSGVALDAKYIIDRENNGLNQSDINSTVETLAGASNFVTIPATSTDTSIGAVFTRVSITPATDTLYRIGNWKHDGSPQYNVNYYSVYGTNSASISGLVPVALSENGIDDNPTPGSTNLVSSGGVAASIVYDISAAHAGAVYETLADALGTGGNNIPEPLRKGGISVKFIQGSVSGSDNKYVQFRLMAQNFTTDVTQWQGVDDEPTAGSENLVKSGGAAQNLSNVITLSTMLSGGVVSTLNVGEYGYNTTENKIYFKTDENGGYTRQSPIKNAIYRYNNTYYKWDGTALVKELDITEIASKFNEIEKQIFSVIFAEGNNSFSISNGETVVFYNSSTDPANVFVRVASNTENIDVAVPLAGGKVVFYTASTDTTIVRIGGTGVINATRESELLGRIFILEKDDKETKADILELKGKVQKTLENQNNNFSIAQGEKFVICNPTANDINVYVRETANSANINVAVPLKSGKAIIYVAEVATTVVRCSSAGIVIMRVNPNTYYFRNIENSINKLDLKQQQTEQEIFKTDEFTAGNTTYNIQKGESVVFFNLSNDDCNVFVKETASSSNIDIARPLEPGKHVVYYAEVDTTIVRIGGAGTISATRDTTIIGRLCIIENRLDSVHLSPIEIVPTTELKDVSTLLAKMDYHNGPYQADVLEQIYALFDELCALHPNNIIKYDPMSSTDVTQNVTIGGVTYQITIYGMADVLAKMTTAGFSDYPEYAKLNGAAGQVEHSIVLDDESVYTFTYAATPSYKTYMYKLVDSTPTQLYTRNPKKNVLLTGAVHGNEIASPFNLYMLICNLLDGKDEIFAQMRAQFDFFVVPCVNGYGMYHVTRGNANRVNINRNFPNGWVLQNNNLTNITERWNNNYSGPSAASEFETQLIMALHSVIAPVCAIDNHNYSKNEFQFYTEITNKYFLPTTYRALELCSLAFRKGLPSYFGTEYKLFISNFYEAAPVKTSGNRPTCGCFFGLNTIFGATLEVSECINYDNGQYTTVWEDDFGNDAFSVAEYTLRTQLALYLNEILKL